MVAGKTPEGNAPAMTPHVWTTPVAAGFLLMAACAASAAAPPGVPAESRAPDLSFPEAHSDQWQGFKRHHFRVGGAGAWIAEPEFPLPGNPWVWCMEFPDAFPERCGAPDLLREGFYYAHLKVGDTYGAPAVMGAMRAFYEEMTRRGLSRKLVLAGISRGGLYAGRFAAEKPESVSVIYGDAPVCDIKSWPAGRGSGRGSPEDWAKLKAIYGFSTDAEALAYDGNPVDTLEPLAAAGVALVFVVGDDDDEVPPSENALLVEERYRLLGGTVRVIRKPGAGHHPHGLDNPRPVVDFILQHGTKP
jgi:pimeloyl-ACP methyl ester carboxylesterase